MTKNLKYIALCLFVTLLAIACSSDGGDTPSTPPTNTQDEINIKAQVWQVMQGASAPRRAHTYDYAAALQAQGSFTCTIYSANTTTNNTSEITTNPDQVNWNASTWVFAHGPYHWPASGDLDFFAYMPATPPSYITDNSDEESKVTYEARNPQFKCKNLPMTNAGQDGIYEFIYGLVTDQNKDNAGSGVTMIFQHPFTRIKLQFSASQENIRINTITLKSIKNNGSYAHNSGWTPSGDPTNLVLTLNHDYTANDEIGTYLMIPQGWTGGIDVNATWDVWGVTKNHDVSTTLSSITWQAGYSYTYTFTITETDLTVNVAKFTEQW